MADEKYPLMLSDFSEKAEKTVKLAEKMSEAFSSTLYVNQFQREYLKVAIMAACLDSHYNGYQNGKALMKDTKE